MKHCTLQWAWARTHGLAVDFAILG